MPGSFRISLRRAYFWPVNSMIPLMRVIMMTLMMTPMGCPILGIPAALGQVSEPPTSDSVAPSPSSNEAQNSEVAPSDQAAPVTPSDSSVPVAAATSEASSSGADQILSCLPSDIAAISDPLQRSVRQAHCDPRVVNAVALAQREHRSVAFVFENPYAETPAQIRTPSLSATQASSQASASTRPVNASTLVPRSQRSAAAVPPTLRRNSWGVNLGLGLPEGASLTLLFEPLSWLRLFAGGLHNSAAFGVQGGLTIMPFASWFISPTLSFSAGHAFEGDANWLAQVLTADAQFQSAVLRSVSYDFVTGRLGLEFGGRVIRFYVECGVSYVRTQTHNFQEGLRRLTGSTTLTATDPYIEALVPSASVGALVRFR